MITVLRSSWALYLGTGTIMIAHGLSSSLLGIRGTAEGLDPLDIGIVMAGYYLGFMLSSGITQPLLQRVGHVRVYAAYASLGSAVLVLYPLWINEYFWVALRITNGICLAGLYIVAESWLNGTNANTHRGQALAVYVATQLIGLILGQWILTTSDPSGYILFIYGTVLMSVGVGPVLLSVAPVPVFETAKPMSFRELYTSSPLAFVGMTLLGLSFSVTFSMLAVFVVLTGRSVADVALMVSAVYVGGTVFQYPAGWISDKIGRRIVVTVLCALAITATIIGLFSANNLYLLLLSAFLIGGGTTPLYSVLLAHANDHIESERMAACGARMIFLQGIGSFVGPPVAGVAMNAAGPWAYFMIIGCITGAMGLYSVYRSVMRKMPQPEEAVGLAPLPLKASPVATEMYIETSLGPDDELGGEIRPSAA